MRFRPRKSRPKTRRNNYMDDLGLHPSKTTVSPERSVNLQYIKDKLGHSADLVIREFNILGTEQVATICYINGIIDTAKIRSNILEPLMLSGTMVYDGHIPVAQKDVKEFILHNVLSFANYKEAESMEDAIMYILAGHVLLIMNGVDTVFAFNAMDFEHRDIDEPVQEALIRGPRDGFNESLNDNLAIIRSKLRDANLVIDNSLIGTRTNRNLSLLYINDLAMMDVVKEVKRRLSYIDLEDIPDTGFIEQLIEDAPLSFFPQVYSTERPDKVISALLEGRVALILDGTPFALIVPVTFNQLLQSPEDYYERWYIGSLIRLLRSAAVFIAIFLPALYVALTSFHQGMIPTPLALSIAASREGVPFPAFIEALIMEVTLELLREAGLRLPRPLGQTVGIIGGIIIGEAAVRAGLVSPIMVIVVAMTAISNFVIPSYSVAISFRILRFICLFFAVVLGLYGIILFFILMMTHLVSLKSFGVPYMSPVAPFKRYDWRDFIIRMPIQTLYRRPKTFHPQDKRKENRRA